MRKIDPIFLKRILISIIILLTFVNTAVIYAFLTIDERTFSKNLIPEIRNMIGNNQIVFENMIEFSPNGRYVTFTTAKDLGMTNSTVWVLDIANRKVTPIEKSKNFSYFSTPKWNSDGTKIAYAKIYPFEIWVSDIKGQNKQLLISETDKEKENYFKPSLGYGGAVDLTWDGNNLVFESNHYFPAKNFAIDSTTAKIVELEGLVTDAQKSLETGEFFSQRSAVWGSDKLGSCKTQTIHSAGCTITAISMVFTKLGIDVDPRKLNAMLSINDQGYFDGCDVRWNVAGTYSEDIKLKGVFFNDYNIDRLNYELSLGNPVIVGFNYVEFTNIPHWIVVTEKVGDIYKILDPWDFSETEHDLEEYGKFDHLVIFEK